MLDMNIFLSRRQPSINTLNTADSMVGTPPNGRFLRNHPHKTCQIRPKESMGKIQLTVFDDVYHIRVSLAKSPESMGPAHHGESMTILI